MKSFKKMSLNQKTEFLESKGLPSTWMKVDPHQDISGGFSYQTLGPEKSYKLPERENRFKSKY